MEKVHELRRAGGTGEMIAWLCPRPDYCDRGRFHGLIEAPHIRSDADPSPRYYFDLDRGKAEIEAYLDAKRIDRTDAVWVERWYGYETKLCGKLLFIAKHGSSPTCKLAESHNGDCQ